jgi:sec-independent protein translocase protein TatC
MTEVAARRPTPASSPVDDSRMSLAEHLIELRKRLLWALAAIAVGTVVGVVLYDQILEILIRPYCELPESRAVTGKCALNSSKVLSEVTNRLSVGMVAGVILSGPFWLYQLWAFIAPGLHRKERRWAVAFITTSFLLFTSGTLFAYQTLDKGLAFLFRFGGPRVENFINVDNYFSFITLTLLAFGVSFLFPLMLIMLNLAGVLTTARMRASRRMVIVLVAIFAAVITPSQDPFTFAAMAGPMYLFYEGAVVFGRVADRRRRRKALADPNYGLADDETSRIDDRPSDLDLTPSPIDDPDDGGPGHR